VGSQLIHVRVPFRRPIETAAGVWTHRDSWIERAEGGEPFPFLGEGPTQEAAMAIDWDGSLAGRKVPVNALVAGGAVDDAVAQARAAVAAGFGTVKLKIGTEMSTGELRRRVSAVREAIGPNVKLRLDANGAWSPAYAPDWIGAVAEFDLEFVEQPIPASTGAGALAEVRAASGVRVGADESLSSVEAARELLDAKAVDVLVLKPSRVGGWPVALDIIELARTARVPVVLSTLFETGAGISVALALAATLPEGPAHGLATANLLESDLLARPLEIVDGRMVVPESLELDEEALERYAVEWVGGWPP
jgi:L-alanine-DL-glutamate epimerase-like enolase superfamily enzyme